MKFTDEQIEEAKRRTLYTSKPHHEHPDCIRIAAEWLAAQQRIQKPSNYRYGIKQFVEAWAGRYVSASDVEVAATLLGLEGWYPCYNIHKRRTLPHLSRLVGIFEAMTQMDYRRHLGRYTWIEPNGQED